MFKEDTRRLQKDYDHLKQDNQHLLKMLETQDVKIQAFARKEEELQKMFRENREKTEEAVLQRDKAMLKEEQYSKTVDLVKGQLKQQLEEEEREWRRQEQRLEKKRKEEVEEREREAEELRRELTILYLEKDTLTAEVNSRDAQLA